MTEPLFNTQDQVAMKAAFSMLKYAHKYFANPSNISRLKKTFKGNEPAEKLIEILNIKQLGIAKYMDFSSNDIEGFKRFENVINDSTVKYVEISSKFEKDTPLELTSIGIKNFAHSFNMNLAEQINDQNIKLNDGEINDSKVSEILDVAWVVQHFALLTTGTLKLEERKDGTLVFKQKHKGLLTSIWFGDALEHLSIKVATSAIECFAVATYQKNEPMTEGVKKLHAQVLSIIPQHWRLGLGSKTLELFHEIADLFIFLINIVQRNQLDKEEKPLSKGEVRRMIYQYPERKGLLKTFELIKIFQKTKKSEDRLFELKKGGLTLGSVKIVRGLIQQMEYFALKKQGLDWHSKLEEDQTRFLLDDLVKCDHLDVLEFELKPDKFDASSFEKLRLDVDFFIRDKSTDIVYAIQLKHVTTDDEAGLLSWVKLLGQKDSKLNKGILQLERLKEVVSNCNSAREYLSDKGLSEKEIMNLKPIVVHNIGSLDCMKVHNDICLYDLHTFKKALSGCRGTQATFKDGYYKSSDSLQVNNRVDLSCPNNVIDTYIKEARFSEIKYFDGAKYITRSVTLGGVKVSAEGVGI